MSAATAQAVNLRRDEFLDGPRFALNAKVDVLWSHTPNQINDFLHRRTTANHWSETGRFVFVINRRH